MFIVYFALWVILCGRWTLEIGAFGLVFAAVAYLFSCMFMGYSPKVDGALLRRAPGALRYGVLLVTEIIKANLAVIRMILDKRFEPKPQLVQFDTALRRERHRVTLANSITLTPGTITVSLNEDRYTVHCLDVSMMEDLDCSAFVRSLEAMESAHEKPAQEAQAEQESEADVLPAQPYDAAQDEEEFVLTGEFVSEEPAQEPETGDPAGEETKEGTVDA